MMGGKRTKLSERDHAKIISLMSKQVPLYMIARKFKVDRHTLSKYIENHQELVDASRDANEAFDDSVEYMFKQKIAKGDLHVAQWYADRKMRHRGYGEHIDTDQNLNNTGRVILQIGRIADSELPKPQNKEAV